MRLLVLFFFIFNISQNLKAQTGATLNEVLFELDGAVWTQQDFKFFMQAKSHKEFHKLNDLKKNDEQLFLISRMFFEQAVDLGMVAKDKTSNLNNSNESETERLHAVIEFLDIKDKQLADGEKSKLWLSFLAKKYKFSAHVSRYKDIL